jgi:ATP-dependent DNA helicase RecG
MASLRDKVQYLKGVGPARAALLGRLGIQTVEDLLYHLPSRYLDRSQFSDLAGLREGQEATVAVAVLASARRTSRRGKPLVEAIVAQGGVTMQCLWFNQPYLADALRPNAKAVLSGRVTWRNGLQMVQPDVELMPVEQVDELLHTGRVVPVYPLTEGLKQRTVRRLIHEALRHTERQLRETLPDWIREDEGLLPLRDSLQHVHYPCDLATARSARKRLVYEELFYLQLALGLRRVRHKQKPAPAFHRPPRSIKPLLDSLPFSLTEAQKKVMREIREDLRLPHPMNRLLQGDVGSGKTVVALMTMLVAADNGYQAALMAPTEVLAEQHARRLLPLLDRLGIDGRFLRGGMRKRERGEALDAVCSGRAIAVLGTHALLEEEVQFHKLGLVIVDEQHRFGVAQRKLLRAKGIAPHCLVMTATPIPRSLAMTFYGDLDVSVLDEIPGDRPRAVTRWVTEKQRTEVYRSLAADTSSGGKAFIVCPLLEESEKSDLRAAKRVHASLVRSLGESLGVGLIHGRLSSAEKEEAMAAFAAGTIRALVATTVVEVGVDVPDATIMVVEHAERFGLAQLHQLRGRVGRGGKPAQCVLITPEDISPEAEARLKTLERVADGFQLAELDLKLRGPGDVMGTRQHGLPELRVAKLPDDQEILGQARRAARQILDQDPALSQPRHTRLRNVIRRKWVPRMELAVVG